MKLLSTLAIASAVAVAATASAQSSTELQVIGQVVPQACTLKTERYTVNLRDISVEMLHEQYQYAKARVGMSVECPFPTSIGFYFADTSLAPLGPDPFLNIVADHNGQLRFFGQYELMLRNGMRDGVETPLRQNWHELSDRIWVNDRSKWVQFSTPEPYRQGSFDLEVNTQVFKIDEPIADELELRGSMSVELVYL